ncbi:MAG: phospholipid carrier-dependent glycosyltransferase [Actinomycetota bacterium]
MIASLLMWAIARRLWGYAWLASAAAFLLGIEGLWFVMSRIAMLDIYVAFFVLCGVWLMLEDRARHGPDSRGRRWWRLAAGISFGLALASKWGALPFFIVAIFIATWWAISDSVAGGGRMLRRLGGVWRSLIFVPVIVYVATYAPWFADSHRYNPPKCETVHADWLAQKGVEETLTGWVSHLGTFGRWVCYQKEEASFHSNLRTFNAKSQLKTVTPFGTPTTSLVTTEEIGHPYFGNAWSWPWIGRPVAHYYRSTGDGDRQRVEHIVGLPNPLIWWTAFFICIPALAWWGLFKRDRIASLLLAFILVGWAPYLYADATGRGVFFFYATPMVPFLVLAVIHTMARGIAWSEVMTWIWIGFVLLATWMFVYFYPVIAAYPLADNGLWSWANHMWLNAPRWVIFNHPLIPGDCLAHSDVIKHFCWI